MARPYRRAALECPDSGRVAGYTGSLAADEESSREVAFACL